MSLKYRNKMTVSPSPYFPQMGTIGNVSPNSLFSPPYLSKGENGERGRGRVSLSDLITECDHDAGSMLVSKINRAGGLMYFRVCGSCGATLPSAKGELSHAMVAKSYRVEEIPDKSLTDQVRHDYLARQRLEREALFEKYQAYLDTQEWRDRRGAVVLRDGECQGCGDAIDCVHHLTYENLFVESLDDLVGLCHRCHMLAHKTTT